MRIRRGVLSVVAAALLLAACGEGADGTTTTTASDPTTTTTVETPTTTADTTTTTVPQSVETVFGYLRSFEGTEDGRVVVRVDEAQMLSGEEAVAAAREDGVIGEDEDLPNDYYIRNLDESTTVEYVVSPDAEILLQGVRPNGSPTLEPVDLDTWSILLGGEDDPGLDWSWYGGGVSPYWFDVQGDEIVKVEEQYLP